MESQTNRPQGEKPVKPKRQLTEKQLDQLAKAREKANAVRKKNAELKRKGKQVTLMKRQQEEEALDQEIASLTGKQKPKQPRKKKAPQLVAQEDLVSSSDDESESSESEPEPEPVSKPRRKAKAKKKPKRVKQESSSDESSDEDYAPDKRQLSRQMRQDSMYDRQMERAFGSLFPNYNV